MWSLLQETTDRENLLCSKQSPDTFHLQKEAFIFQAKYQQLFSIEWHQVVHYLPQHSLAFPIKVKDLLIMAFYRDKKWFEEYTAQQYQALTDLAARFGISHLLERNAKELSGGELQLCWLVQSFLPVRIFYCWMNLLSIWMQNRILFFNLLNEMQTLNFFICLCVTHDLPFKKESYGTILVSS